MAFPGYCLLGLLTVFTASSSFGAESCTGPDSAYRPLAERYQRGLLFKLEKCNQPASYIFGTVHEGKPEIEQAAHAAFAVLPGVETAGFEIITDPKDIPAIIAQYVFLPKTGAVTLTSLIGEKYFTRLAMLYKGTSFTPEVLDRMQPWAPGALLEFVKARGALEVLDDKIKDTAIANHKGIFALETLSGQFEVFSTLPQPVQIAMLKDAIDHYAEMEKITARMEADYVARDIKGILLLEQEVLRTSDDPEMDKLIFKRLLTDRNRTMEKAMQPHLKAHSSLIAIGAMHLLGADGVLALLEHDGYRVTQVD